MRRGGRKKEYEMMRAMQPVTNPKTDKTFWNQVGVAFINRNDDGELDSVSISLNSLPIDGEIKLFYPLPPKEEQPKPNGHNKRKGRQRYHEEEQEDIPF